MYTLETKNLPILSTLQGWKYGFNSPFMAEVYFCSMRQFTDLKWGTMNPIMMRDAEFGPVRLRAYGTYVVKVNDPQILIRQIVGTDGRFTVEEIVNQLRNLIVSRFAEIAGQSKIPVLDMAANYGELGEFLTKRIAAGISDLWPRADKAAGGKHFAACGGRRSSRQAHQHGSGRKPCGLYAIQYCQFDSGCGQKSRRPGGRRRRHRHGNGDGGADRTSAVRTTAGRFCAQRRRRPFPGAATYFVAIEGKQTGPFDMQTLASQASAGRLTQQTLVWTQGMAQWTPAGQVPALAAIFASVPPPLPPNA